MKKIECAGILFVSDNKILLEDRRKISKHGEEWSFFGGKIEKDETAEQALLREIKEELSFELKEYTFFSKYIFCPIPDLELTYHMFISPIPDLHKLKVHAGAGLKIFELRDALNLKITAQDKKIMREIIQRGF